MIRSFAFVPVIFCAAAVVSAQAPVDRPAPPAAPPAAQQPYTPAQPPSTPATPQTPAASASTMKVTYSGCVKPGTLPNTFVLDSAELAPAAGATTTTPSGAVGTSGMMKTTLNLTTKTGVDLKAHTNHKIEVVGTLAPPKSPATPADAGAAASVKPAQEFNVDSFKMISATCP